MNRGARDGTRAEGSVERTVDTNPDHGAAASSWDRGRVPGLEVYVADIQTAPLPFPPVDLVFAALVFEYVTLPAAVENLARVCRPGGHLVAILQQPSVHTDVVTPSPYTSVQVLGPFPRLVRLAEMVECAA